MNIFIKNVIGEFVLDKSLKLSKKPKKHIREIKEEEYPVVLENFKNPIYFNEFRNRNIYLVKKQIRDSFHDDTLLLQCGNSISEIEKSINTLTKRLREWIAYPMPEFNQRIKDNEHLINDVINFEKIDPKDLMSKDIGKEHITEIKNLAKNIKNLIELKKNNLKYIEKVMKKICPNLLEITGASLGYKLLILSGSLEKLAMSAASKIQLLGAEEALFRHLKTGAKVPKHGVIHEHPYIQKSKEKGKAARRLADKISIAIKVDFFKGEFIGDKLKGELI